METETNDKIPEGLKYTGLGAKLAGPEIVVRAYPGIVATRKEQREELERRRTFGVVRNSL